MPKAIRTPQQEIDDIPSPALRRLCKHACGMHRVTESRIDKIRAQLLKCVQDWVYKVTLVTCHGNRVVVKGDDVSYAFEAMAIELNRKGLDPNTKLLTRCPTDGEPRLPCGFLPKTRIHAAIRAAADPDFRWSPVALEFLHYNLEQHVSAKLAKLAKH